MNAQKGMSTQEFKLKLSYNARVNGQSIEAASENQKDAVTITKPDGVEQIDAIPVSKQLYGEKFDYMAYAICWRWDIGA